MKTRQGFVSNSSSTSYVLAFKTNEKCKCCGRSDPDFADLIDAVADYDSERTHIHARGLDRVLEFYRSKYGNDWEDRSEEMIKSRIEKFFSEHGVDEWELIACNISYHDDIVKDALHEKQQNGTLVSIWNDHE